MLYPAPLRDFLLELAVAGLFRARWTDQIHEEWICSLLANRPDLDPLKLARTRQLMDASVMDCLVTEYEPLVDAITLPDADDRHVLAAAIKAGADGIVTFNQKDFPSEAVSRYDIEVLHPDEFIQHQFGLDTAAVVIAASRCRARLQNPPHTVEEYLEILERQSLLLSVAELRPYAALL